MNNKLEGIKFEEEALEYLKKIFPIVDYISKKNVNSPFDFVAYKDNKIYYGDAKIGNHKPTLTPSQKDIDFIIVRDKNLDIKIYWKHELLNNVNFGKNTTIKIEENTKEKLEALKLVARESYGSVINRLIIFNMEGRK